MAKLAKRQRAPLPVNYEAAQKALAECSRIDECKEWADRAAAMASYGHQSRDETMIRLAVRIKERAYRRLGILAEQVERRRGANQNIGSGTGPKVLTRKAAAEAAGISKRQLRTALQVAQIPEDTFDAIVDSENPPTLTELAEMGKNFKPNPEQSNPAFPRATKALGTVRRFAEFCEANDPREIASAVMSHEIGPTKKRVGIIDGWLDLFVSSLGGVIDVRAQ
jgi:hypothetical protein